MGFDKDYITLSEAAELLNITRQSVHWAIKKGRILSKRDEYGRIFVNLDSLDYFEKTKFSRMETIKMNGEPLIKNEHGLITVNEAIKISGINAGHIYYALRHGYLKHTVIDRHIILKIDDVKAYAEKYLQLKNEGIRCYSRIAAQAAG